ncbi:hypothetical protein [Streptomyces sp. RLA2-12]|uniref:hypothetical protein n=1 Tax=Streptomyces sp. RLA2-12 TaxID=2721242 RepID=UPI00145D8515|nr:hypothetical protein [Streptomyces sp. RLA2-12]NMI54498.1 hypothetical protein [Streptomyces sp. RLA2-12]
MLAKLTGDLPLAGVDAAGAAYWQARLAGALPALAGEEPRTAHRGPVPAFFRLADPPAPAAGVAAAGEQGDGHTPTGTSRTGMSRTGMSRAGMSRAGTAWAGTVWAGTTGWCCPVCCVPVPPVRTAGTAGIRAVPRWGRWPGGC